jgi:hypothetical protein
MSALSAVIVILANAGSNLPTKYLRGMRDRQAKKEKGTGRTIRRRTRAKTGQ